MKTIALVRAFLALAPIAVGNFALAQTDPTAPATLTTPTTPPPTPTEPVSASTESQVFATASLAVKEAVAEAQNLAAAIRATGATTSVQLATVNAAGVTLPTAVAKATGAIVQESRMARTDILAERQAALTRLRLAQTEADRRRLVEELRTQAGQRMEEQREVARLVRERLRELRATTSLVPRSN